MVEAAPVERSNGGIRKDFYTVAEAAKALGVGQRRILEMLKTREIAGERDPTSSLWRISAHAVHELAPKKPADTAEPSAVEDDTVEVRVTEETQATEGRVDSEEPLLVSQPPGEDPTGSFSEQPTEEAQELIGESERLNEDLQLEQQAEKVAWQEEKESLLATADRERQRAEALQEDVARLRSELRTVRERLGELERLSERLQLEQQAEKVAWQEEKVALLAAANREHQRIEALQKEVARLNNELKESRELTSKLKGVHERLRHEQQAETGAWQEEKEFLLATLDRERQHVEVLKQEVQNLTAELETRRRRRSWWRLRRK